LLAVAADDGVMPQTIEHLAIVDLLGVSRGLVVLTKCDLVGAARRTTVKADIVKLLTATSLTGADIIETSIVSGQGTDELRSRLAAAARDTIGPDSPSRFRLAIDRCFTLRGVGTVVTGTVLSGAVSLGDEIVLSPSGVAARVRSIHAQNRPTTRSVAGQRCALNLTGAGIAKDAIKRGEMAIDPSLHAPTGRIDAKLRLLSRESETMPPWFPVRLHHAAIEVGAHVVPLDTGSQGPGDEVWVQLVLNQPIAAATGDRFVLRDTSAQRTLGGGRFVDLRAPTRRRRSPQRLAWLDAMGSADAGAAMARLLDLPPRYLDLDAFVRDRALSTGFAGETDLTRVKARGTTYVFSRGSWSAVKNSLHAALRDYHAANPAAAGAPLEMLRRAIEPRLPEALFSAVCDEFSAQRFVAVAGGSVHLPDHAARLTRGQEALWAKIHPLLGGDARFAPPRLDVIAGMVRAEKSDTRKAIKVAVHLGFAEEVAPDHFYLRSAVAEVAAIVGELVRSTPDGQFGVTQLRDRLATGRKNAIELLEYFDRRGITLRRGDLRRVDVRKLVSLR
jgi:selenocysteine-specific elongation factor